MQLLERRAFDRLDRPVSFSQQIEIAREQKSGVNGVPSGFTELDRMTSGWQPSDLVIIAARPAMGKTAFVLSLARNAAVDFTRPVAVFSLEMASVQLVQRLISSESELSAEKLKKGQLEDHEFQQMHVKIEEDAWQKDQAFIRAMMRYEIDLDLFGVEAARKNLVKVDPQLQFAVGLFPEAQQLLEMGRRAPAVRAAR